MNTFVRTFFCIAIACLSISKPAQAGQQLTSFVLGTIHSPIDCRELDGKFATQIQNVATRNKVSPGEISFQTRIVTECRVTEQRCFDVHFVNLPLNCVNTTACVSYCVADLKSTQQNIGFSTRKSAKLTGQIAPLACERRWKSELSQSETLWSTMAYGGVWRPYCQVQSLKLVAPK